MKHLGIVFILLSYSVISWAQNIGFSNDLYTRPERTQYEETSLHSDVMRFVNALSESSDFVHLEMMGASFEGKDLPLVIMSKAGIDNPQDALDSDKPRIYIQGNIHGGEVEGKEALMILMREIAFGNKQWMLDNQILLFCPLFNPDGNDNLGPNNRNNQDGSPYLAGTRANGQGFDLNRDGLKLESFEGLALAEGVMQRWDPHMFVDLHTTNGTWHGYEITYAPGLTTAGHPGSEEYMNEELLPWLTNRLRERTGFETTFYGGFYEYPPKQFWGMYPEPRFLTNSFSLKNKLALLVETFSHDHFEKRILSNVHFVSTLLAYTNANSSEIIQVLTDTDNAVVEEIQNMQTGFSKGLEFDYSSSPVTRDILAYEVSRGKHTEKKLWFSGVNVFLKMEAVREAMVPKAYVFPEEMSALADKLSDHGVTIQQLEQNETFEGEKYEVRRLNNETRSYQGHFPATLEGSYLESEITMPLGSWFVDMAQPLAYLIFYLLEPEADDGLVYWNYFDDYLKEKGVSNQRVDFPVFKVFSASSSSDDPELDIVFVRFDADQKNIIVSGIPDNHLQKSVDLISAKGQILTHKNIPQSSNYFQFDCGDLDLGVYLIRVNLGDQTLVRKVFVRHLE